MSTTGGGKIAEPSQTVIISIFLFIEMYEVHKLCVLMKPIVNPLELNQKAVLSLCSAT